MVFLMLILCNSLNRKLPKALCKLNNLLVLLISIRKQTKNVLNDELGLRDAEEEEEAVAWVLSDPQV